MSPLLKDVEELGGALSDMDRRVAGRFEALAESLDQRFSGGEREVESLRRDFWREMNEDRQREASILIQLEQRIQVIEGVLGLPTGGEVLTDACAGDPGPPAGDLAGVRGEIRELCEILRGFKVYEVHMAEPKTAPATVRCAAPAQRKRAPRAPRPAEIRAKEAKTRRRR